MHFTLLFLSLASPVVCDCDSVWGGKDFLACFERGSALLRMYEPEVNKAAVLMTPVRHFRHESPLYTHTVVAAVHVTEKNRWAWPWV